MNVLDKTLVFKLEDGNDLSELNITSEIKHFIADLRGVDLNLANKIKDKFTMFAGVVSKMNGSFVVVYDFSFDEDLTIVPTIQEAYDYIEMDEMERQLEL